MNDTQKFVIPTYAVCCVYGLYFQIWQKQVLTRTYLSNKQLNKIGITSSIPAFNELFTT